MPPTNALIKTQWGKKKKLQQQLHLRRTKEGKGREFNSTLYKLIKYK